ncbi:DNA-binding transcriptional regulator, LysR family [Cupriavidus sp. OV038]|jgi:DNA-binding transcriptional LysR family regulator|uniref:LysR family transcriptional regulator n=1 Tax=unclassified Cupriavidus TaxID=2640874 RepID=UPI0008E1C341|nr:MULTISPECIES: LysR family transcriptional regulator [unclassified Cupriavidus]SFC12022.1 DNA-binding transcriptional regulator, LysR family [Cupriavidus sp. OV038]SFP07934.1 DNA-binding transcriptional regulator, LysR family [Cupriavidus sp. OV096]
MDTPDRLLRIFLRIAELKSLSRAAEDLDQTQSGVSRQLATLEAQFGKPLFVRTGRGVALTEAGQKLQEALEGPYRAIDQAVDAIRDAHGTTQGTVRLAIVHTVSYYFIADVVASFVSAHPNVNLSLMGRSSADVVALVESGKADLGVVYDTAVDTATLTTHPLFEDEMCLVTLQRSDGLQSASQDGLDLRGQPLRLVGFPHGYALRRMVESAGLQPTYVAEAETVDAILKLVSAGVGDCILPCRLPDKLLREYGLHKLKIRSPLLRRRMVAVTHAARHALPLADVLLASALQVARTLKP